MFEKVSLDTGEFTGKRFSSDQEAFNDFLERRRPPKQTEKALLREWRRLTTWLEFQGENGHPLPIKELSYAHAFAYQSLIENPPQEAISEHREHYYLPVNKDSTTNKPERNPKWRPFVALNQQEIRDDKAKNNGVRTTPKVGGLSGTSLNAAISIINTIFTYFEKSGYIKFNPFAPLKSGLEVMHKEERRETMSSESGVNAEHHFTIPEMIFMDRLMKHFAHNSESIKDKKFWTRSRFIFLLLRRTALRREEAVSVKVGNIVSIRLPISGQNRKLIKGIGKGNKDFSLPYTSDVEQAFKEYQKTYDIKPPSRTEKSQYKRYKESFLIFKPLSKKDSDETFSTKGISDHTLNRWVKEMFLKISKIIELEKDSLPVYLEDIDEEEFIERLSLGTCHWLRHSAITEYAEECSDITELQAFARHESIQTTTAVYTHVTQEQTFATIDKLLPLK